jgi:hypothetical protein
MKDDNNNDSNDETKTGKVVQLNLPINRKRTTDLNHDVFSNMPELGQFVDSYSRASDYLKTHNIAVDYYNDMDYRDIKMLSPDSPIYAKAQCRETPLTEKVEELAARFDKGEQVILPPMAIEFDGEYVLAFGNTRYQAKILSTDSTGVFVIIDPDGKLSLADKMEVLVTLANMSNVKSLLHQDQDAPNDILKQARAQWSIIKSAGTIPEGEHTSITLNSLEWFMAWDSASNSKDLESRDVKFEWYNHWLDTVKPTGTTNAGHRRRSFNIAFPIPTSEDGLDRKGSMITEWTSENIKGKYDSAFPTNVEWNPSRNCPSSLVYHGTSWQILQPWGTNTGNVTNLVVNLRNKILNRMLSYGSEQVNNPFETVSVIVTGDTGLTNALTRKNHIAIVLSEIEKYNKQALLSSWNLPVVSNVLFPQMLRSESVNVRIDRDFSYERRLVSPNTDDFIFVETNKPAKGKDINYSKRCSTCSVVKPIKNFGVCRSKSHVYKDALQARCKQCQMKHNASKSRTTIVATAIG